MERPPVKLVAEELSKFVRTRVVSVSGNARTEKESVRGKEVVSVLNGGKNLFIAFPNRSVRVHFLMYGSYRMNEEKEGRGPPASPSSSGKQLSTSTVARCRFSQIRK